MIGLGLGIWGAALRGGAWSPAALFGATDLGDWGDAANLSSGAVSQWDGRRGVISLRQATAASQPVAASVGGLSYVTFDGSNDGLVSSAALDLSGTDAVTVLVAAHKLSDATQAMLIEHGIGASAGRYDIQAPPFATPGYSSGSRGTINVNASANTGHAAPITSVLSLQARISTDTNILRSNGVQIATASGDQGTGNYGSYTMGLGSRTNLTLPFNGRVYAWLIIGRFLAAAELGRAEAWMAARCGVTLP